MSGIKIYLERGWNALYCEYKQASKAGWLIVGFLSFAMLFMLYYTCPFYSDDLIYKNCWNSEVPLKSMSDIMYYQYMHYMQWGGRSVAHTLLQVLFLIGRPLASIFNSLCHMCLAYMIMRCAINKSNIFIYIEILGILFFLNPAFEETLVWYTGNANYMWTTLIILLAIYPFLKMIEGSSKKNHFLYPFAFLAGWSNENMATTMILFMICCIIYYYKKEGKINIKAVIMVGLAGLGCILLLLAPGNFARASDLPSGIMGIMYRGHGQVNSWCNWLFPMWILCILTYIWNKSEKKQENTQIRFIIVWAIASVLVMVMSPSYPVRATFGSFVLLVIAIQKNLDDIKRKEIIIRRIMLDCLVFVGWMGSLASVIILAYVRSKGVYIPG